MKAFHARLALLLVYPLIATSQGSENPWTGELGMSPSKSPNVPQSADTAVRDKSGKILFKALYAPMPVYPMRPRYNEGKGLFLLRLRPNGTVSAVEVERSTGSREFDLAASEALIHWRFPANPPLTRVRMPISFKRL
jgi:TonB family protein